MWSICVGMVLILLMTSQALALVLCAPKNGVGNLKVREECRKKEIQIDPSELGLSGPAVYDSNGAKVGDIIDTTSPAVDSQVLFKYEAQAVALGVNKTGYYPRDQLFFESPGCMGQALVNEIVQDYSLYPRIAINFPGNTIYIIEAVENPPQVQAQSFYHPQTGCENSSAPVLRIPANPLVDLDTLFAPPFEVR